MECLFFTQCCTAYVLCSVIDTTQDIDLYKERPTEELERELLKSPHSKKGAEREISSRAAHQSRPDRYAFSLAIHTDSLAS